MPPLVCDEVGTTLAPSSASRSRPSSSHSSLAGSFPPGPPTCNFVRTLHRYYDPVRLLGLVHDRLICMWLSPSGPLSHVGKAETSRFPILSVCGHAVGLRLRRVRAVLAMNRPARLLPSSGLDRVGRLEYLFSELNTTPAHSPVYASPASSRLPDARLGAVVARYSFHVRLFHPLLSISFTGRSQSPDWLQTTDARQPRLAAIRLPTRKRRPERGTT